MADSVSELALDISRGSLARGEALLSDLRSRAGTLIAAASIASSFLATKHGELDPVATLAVAAYVVSVASATYVLLPHTTAADLHGSILNELQSERRGDLTRAHLALTEWFEELAAANAAILSALSRWYSVSCFALAAETVLWTVSVTGTL